jgi:predicted dehydrogenase
MEGNHVSKKVRWGILSTAKIAREQVIPAMRSGELTDVVAIASRDRHRAQDVAAEFAIPKAYGSYDALLTDPEIDAIYNPLPNHLHAPLTIKALEAGKHVLCEKPIALNAQEAQEIEVAQKRSGRLVAEAFMVRFHPQWAMSALFIRSSRITSLIPTTSATRPRLAAGASMMSAAMPLPPPVISSAQIQSRWSACSIETPACGRTAW